MAQFEVGLFENLTQKNLDTTKDEKPFYKKNYGTLAF